MIKKITNNQNQIARHKLAEKINELVDAVNSIVSVQEKLIDSRFVVETKHEDPVDKFAEQRRWIGKLCKFWSDRDKPEKCVYDILHYVFDLHHEDSPFQDGDGLWWEYCEPVSEDLIYKGE